MKRKTVLLTTLIAILLMPFHAAFASNNGPDDANFVHVTYRAMFGYYPGGSSNFILSNIETGELVVFDECGTRGFTPHGGLQCDRSDLFGAFGDIQTIDPVPVPVGDSYFYRILLNGEESSAELDGASGCLRIHSERFDLYEYGKPTHWLLDDESVWCELDLRQQQLMYFP